MYALALACLVALPSNLQEPAVAESESQAKTEAPTPWEKLSRLAGGEWNASGEGVPPNFHRFWHGPGEHSLWAHTRSAEDLAAWPKSEAVFFWHPGKQVLRGLSVSEGGTVFDQTLTWEGETLNTDLDYYVQGNKIQFASRWKFLDQNSYDWTLFSKTPNGLSESMSVHFEHSPGLRELPEVAPPTHTAAKPLAFLSDLTGMWQALVVGDDTKVAMGALDFRFEAGGHALIVRGSEGDKGRQRPFQGLAFWHPATKQVQYLQVDDRGELRTGTITSGESGIVFELEVFAGENPSKFQETWKKGPQSGMRIERVSTTSDGRKKVVHLEIQRP